MLQFLAINVFIFGYLLISLEHKIKISKSAVALTMGALLWLLVPFFNPHFEADLAHSAADIFEIVIFLLAAMSLVEILVHYRFFVVVRNKIYALGLTERRQLITISLISFFLSGIWVLPAISVGTGGSLLLIGSAAGVVAMGMVKELNFTNYLKVATFPALAGFFVAVADWIIQYFVFGI